MKYILKKNKCFEEEEESEKDQDIIIIIYFIHVVLT